MIGYRLIPGLKKVVILRDIFGAFRNENMSMEFASMPKTEEDTERLTWLEQNCPNLFISDAIRKVLFKGVVLEHAAWTKKETEKAGTLREEWFKVKYNFLRWQQDPEVKEALADENRRLTLQASEVWGVDLPGGLESITAYGRTLGAGTIPLARDGVNTLQDKVMDSLRRGIDGDSGGVDLAVGPDESPEADSPENDPGEDPVPDQP
jgi:hypothetical protein